MSEGTMVRYFDMLAQKITSMYGITLDDARRAVEHSAIQEMMRECPEYVGHVSIHDWADEIYEEMLAH